MFENLFVFSTGVIGLVTIILILFRYKSNSITNIYLILIFFVIVIRFLIIGLFSIFNASYLHYILNNFNNMLIIIIPLTFLYFNHLIVNKKTIEMKDSYHFILPLLFVLVDFLDDRFFVTIPNKNVVFLSFFIIYTLYYIVWNYRILYKNVWKKEVKYNL